MLTFDPQVNGCDLREATHDQASGRHTQRLQPDALPGSESDRGIARRNRKSYRSGP